MFQENKESEISTEETKAVSTTPDLSGLDLGDAPKIVSSEKFKGEGKRCWYVIQTASGQESKVKGHIERRIETMQVYDKIHSVVVPERNITRVKNGKRVEKKEKEYPGYVLVEMVLDEDTWRTVREAPGVLSFIGNKNKPTPISESEVRKILRKSALLTTPKVGDKAEIDFKIGETVKIQAGPFEDFLGEVAEINEERMTVKVNVVVFGRSTPTEVPVNHLDRVS